MFDLPPPSSPADGAGRPGRFRRAAALLLTPVRAPVIASIKIWRRRQRRHIGTLEGFLWRGREAAARLALERVATDPRAPLRHRRKALAALAVRAHFCGDRARAMEFLQAALLGRPEGARDDRTLLLAAQVAAELDRGDEARALLARLSDPSPSAALVEANAATDDSARLVALNRLYAAADLVPLTRPSAAEPLALSRLMAAAAAPPPAATLGTVSVIVPAFNAAATLPSALASLQAQSYRDLEILVVDDASGDDTAAVAEALAVADPRLRVLRLQSNRGAYAARNAGLAAAKGQFVTVHDADDWSHPQKIATQVAGFAADPEAVAVGSHWVRATDALRFTAWRLRAELIVKNMSSLMLPRDLFAETGPWDTARVSADQEFIDRLTAWYGEARLRWVCSGAPLAFGRAAEGSLTAAADTHAVSQFLGIRFYYREATRHWLAAQRQADPTAHRDKYRVLPEELFRRDVPVRPADLHLIGDAGDVRVIAEMARLAHETPGPIAVSHRPRFDPDTRESFGLAPAFFDLVGREDVFIALDPSRVEAPQTLQFDRDP